MTARRRWPVVLAVIAAVALAAGALLMRTGPSAKASTDRPDARPASSHHDEAQSQSGPTERSAVDTALRLAAAPQQWLYLDDQQLAVAVRHVASPDAADRLVTEVSGEVSLVRDALRHSSGRIWWIVRPLAWRVVGIRDGHASVSVWTVSILSASDVAVPQSDWFTSRFDLEWINGRWLLRATRDERGPTPQLGGRDAAWQPEPFDDALAGFTRVGAEDES